MAVILAIYSQGSFCSETTTTKPTQQTPELKCSSCSDKPKEEKKEEEVNKKEPSELNQTILVEEPEKESKETNNHVTAEISVGELIDKITILKIKSHNIKDETKLDNIHTELKSLSKTKDNLVPKSSAIDALETKLLEINKTLWVIEDDIRDKERKKTFDQEFIELARSVYYTNDKRCAVKRNINELVGSRLVEEKSYAAY